MNLQVNRVDFVIAVALGSLLTILGGHFSPAAHTIETREMALVIPASKATVSRDPDAGEMDAEPDQNNWNPADGESHYGDKSAPDDDQDDDDDLDSSYDPPEPADTTPI